MDELVTILRDFGFPVALAVYLIWYQRQTDARDAEEKKALAARLGLVEDFLRNIMLETIKENSVALRGVLEALKDLEEQKEKSNA